MPIFIDKADILGPAQEVAAAAGTGRPMAQPAGELSGISNMLGGGQNTLSQIENIVNGVSNMISAVERIRNAAQKAAADQGAINGTTPKDGARTIDDIPFNGEQNIGKPIKATYETIQPTPSTPRAMKITLNEPETEKYLTALFASLETSNQKELRLIEVAGLWKNPITRAVLWGQIKDALKKDIPKLVIVE